ncbi:MAG: hypothetical protein WAR83_11645 [Flavobacteriales bacterium]|nr:hypothetical protein [Flavobacteriales bacterium]
MKNAHPKRTHSLPDEADTELRYIAEMDCAAMDRNLLNRWYHDPEERAELADKLARIRTEMRQRRMLGSANTE